MNATFHARHRRGLAGLVIVLCLLTLSVGYTPAAATAADLDTSIPPPEVLPVKPSDLVQPAAASPPAPTFAGNRNKHIVLLNGYLTSSQGKKDVNGEWSEVIPRLREWGWPAGEDAQGRDWIGGMAVYNCDENLSFNTGHYGKPGVVDIHDHHHGGRTRAGNHSGVVDCGSIAFPRPATTPHTTETTIQHLAYHWAWTIKHTFGTECIKVIAHSMGGLIVRYAIAMVQAQDADFPWDICVEDVVTLGTPHNGSPNAGFWCPDWQCLQQEQGSDFINWLGANARNPKTPGGTDWTTVGSTDDGTAPVPSATNANMDPAHAVVYEEAIEHSSAFFAQHYWKNSTSSDITANIRWKDEALGSEATTQEGPWPIRHTDMSLAYNHWGCGVGNETSAFPMKNGVVTVGEPYHADFDCWYYIDVPFGHQLKVRMASLNNEDLDLYLYNSLTAMPACQATSGGSTETCTVSGGGRWWARVGNYADTRNPFTIQATTQNDCSTGVDAGGTSASATTISPISNCNAFLAPPMDGEDWYQFQVNSGQDVSFTIAPNPDADFDLCLFDPNGTQVDCSFNGTGAQDDVSTTGAGAGNWRVRVNSYGNSSGTYNLSLFLATPQNDCGTGDDAGDSVWTPSPITLPKVNCSGQLFWTNEFDTEDYYQFPVSAGAQIDASMTPNASSNYNICIYNPVGTVVASCTSGSTGGTDTLSYVAPSAGDYRLRVTRASGTGSYTLSVSATSQNDCGIGADAGNTHGTASSISLPQSNCSATLHSTADLDDYYKFPVTSGQVINANMTPNAGANFNICLYNPSGSVVVSCTTGGTGVTDSLSHTATTTGDYRLRVTRSSGTGSYTMSASLGSAQNDCGIGGDAGGSHAAASSISLPKTNCSASLPGGSDIEDWYQFSVTSGQQIVTSMTPNASADFDVCLFDPSGTSVGCSAGGTGATDGVTYTAGVSGSWRFQVYIYGGSSGSYTMSVSAGAAPQNDCGLGADAGNTHGAASLISLPKTNCTATLVDSSDIDDYYKFSVTSGQTINGSIVNNASSDYDICLYRPDGTTAVACTVSNDTITHVATVTGDYRLRVKRYSGTGNYTMSVSTSGGTVTVRTDDGTRETSSPFNYNDDVAVKRLDVTSAQLSGKTTATLYVYGQSYQCGGSGNKFNLTANGNWVTDLDPCVAWSSSTYSWKAFNVPISYLTSGTNSFQLGYNGPQDWTSLDVNLAVDSTTPDNDDISYDYNAVSGKLMWYLVLS